MPTPLSILRESIKAVPAVKYALGIAGIASVLAIVGSFHLDFKVALIGMAVMLLFMTLLVIFAALSNLAPPDLRLPALVFTWFSLLLLIAVAFSMFFSVFFGRPVDLKMWITPNVSIVVPAETSHIDVQKPSPQESTHPVSTSTIADQKTPLPPATPSNISETPATASVPKVKTPIPLKGTTIWFYCENQREAAQNIADALPSSRFGPISLEQANYQAAKIHPLNNRVGYEMSEHRGVAQEAAALLEKKLGIVFKVVFDPTIKFYTASLDVDIVTPACDPDEGIVR
jgi:hypothetical protein